MLAPEEKQTLLDIARLTLNMYLMDRKIPSFDDENYPDALMKKTGAFVTLFKNGKLRGCIGRIHAEVPLCKAIRDMTISAATRDYRFRPVSVDELDEIQLEISVLSEPVKIRELTEIELGKHGIYIKKGMNSGTYLPEVAGNTGWDLEQILGHCARDKAHIGWNGWRDAEIYIYETILIRENDKS